MTQIRGRLCLGLALLLVPTLLVPGGAHAQFQQYTAPGSFEELRESMESLLERSMKDARWRFGPAFVHPWIGLRDVSYVDQESDVAATVGAGIRGYLPVKELTLAVHALPEVRWAQSESEQNRLDGRYGIGLFGNFGRTGLELSVTREDVARFFSRQLEVRVNTRDELATASVEVDVGRGISMFGGGSIRQLSFFQEDALTSGVSELNRDEEHLRLGFRFNLPRGLGIGLGVEDSKVDFAGSEDRSNSGTSPILELGYDTRLFSFLADLAYLDLEPEPGSGFVPYQEVAGSLQVAWRTAGPVEIQFSGYRNLVYSGGSRWAYFQDTGLSVGANTSLTSRMSLRLFAETGQDEYVSFMPVSPEPVAPEPVAPERNDDFDAFGGSFQFKLDRFTFSLGASRTDYDSSLPEFDRTSTVISSRLSLGFGGSNSPWG